MTNQKLFLSSEWYIPIDEQGYCSVEAVYEGTLGAIVKIKSTKSDTPDRALKVPRLRADTLRENAYIVRLMQEEAKCVVKTHDKLGCLLVADKTFEQGFLAQPIALPGSDEKDQEGQLIALSYSAGKPPRFVGVRLGDKPGIFPAGLRSTPKFTMLLERLKEAEEQLKKKKTPIFALGVSNSEKTLSGDVNQFLIDKSFEDLWVVAPPSIIYEWAEANLQEMMSRRLSAVHKWDVPKLLAMTQRMLNGLSALHEKDTIHGDMRPANVMHLRDGADNPGSYVLCDYGGFALGVAGGDSVKGAMRVSLGRERSSPFYAPERRGGREVENADAALVCIANKSILVALGWRRTMADDGAAPRADVVDSLKKFGDWEKSPDSSSLTKGDQLQIAQFLFGIEATGILPIARRPGAPKDGNDTDTSHDRVRVYKCHETVWRVFHDKLVVPDTEAFRASIGELRLLPLPNSREIYQYSAATDIFGIGATLLYCLCLRAKHVEDSVFEQTLACLKSVPFFQAVWSQVSHANEQLVKALEEARQSSKGGKEDYDALGLAAKPMRFGPEAASHPQQNMSFRQHTLETAALLIKTTPGLKDVLTLCGSNSARFLMIVHFVLSCLHRRTSLLPQSSPGESSPSAPFCESRIHKKNERAAIVAAAALQKILDSWDSPVFKWLGFDLSEVECDAKDLFYYKGKLEYDPRYESGAAIDALRADDQLSELLSLAEDASILWPYGFTREAKARAKRRRSQSPDPAKKDVSNRTS